MQRRNLIALLFKGHPPSRRRTKNFTLPPLSFFDEGHIGVATLPAVH